MATFTDFLPGILADPLDDAPRLVLADWLMERDDPLGEFIRVQCELARVPESRWQKIARLEGEEAEGVSTLSESYDADDLRAQGLCRRELALWGGYTFAPPLPHGFRGILRSKTPNGFRGALRSKTPRDDDGDCLIRRGFVEAVTLSAVTFVREGVAVALFQAQPVTRVVFVPVMIDELSYQVLIVPEPPSPDAGRLVMSSFPQELVPFMRPGLATSPDGSLSNSYRFNSIEAYEDAASEAAVAFGRAAAKLPALAAR